MTHYSNGELDYISLQEWQRDQEMYRKIIRIPFYEKYRRWKMFSMWKSVMRRQKFRAAQKVLNNNLFVLDPTLRDSLLAVRALCCKITNWNIMQCGAVLDLAVSKTAKGVGKTRQS